MRKKEQAGFSLVEVLVSVFVVSIGIFCSSALELTAMRTTQQSGYQTIALQLAAEIANQIRATPIGDGQAASSYFTVNYESDIELPVLSATCFTVSSNCTGNDLAEFNIYTWEKRMKATLPKGRLQICRDSDPWDTATNRYKWGCRGSQSGVGQLVIKIGWDEKNATYEISRQAQQSSPPLIALAVGI